MPEPQFIKVAGISAGMAPFAFQHYAKDFFEAYKKIKGGPRFSPARLFLLARSIELASKGLHLGQGRTHDQIFGLNHDLESACDPNTLSVYGLAFDKTEMDELKKANEYYKRKGFEYFLYKAPGITVDRSGPQQALSGWPDLPNEEILEGLLIKLLEIKLV